MIPIKCELCSYWMDRKCHRHAPVLVTETIGEEVGRGLLTSIEHRAVLRTQWPQTHADDFCGDWEQKVEAPEKETTDGQ
jgi:hypothetical protein